NLYDGLGIPFYATTGNHDWGLADSPAAEILYSLGSRSWHMPALYYTFTAGPAQFFAMASNAMSETQTRWLDGELARSTAKWKIVYAHHPIYSYSGHGENPQLQKTLLPVLRNRVQVYLAGHDHVFQHLKPEAGVNFVVSSAAGQGTRPANSGPNTLAADSFYGFTVFDIGVEHLTLTAVDSEGKVRYKTELR
ncbi:MAG: metallophosphoesterase, partial [Acidobacteria bacterium]|nr:metallophosphoesterase [Acidobacteriota bacterium]